MIFLGLIRVFGYQHFENNHSSIREMLLPKCVTSILQMQLVLQEIHIRDKMILLYAYLISVES